MVRPTLSLLALSFFSLLPFLPQLAPAVNPQGNTAEASSDIRWRTDYTAARREAIAAGKPLFVVFRCER